MANTAVIVPERSRSDSKHASLLGDNPVGVLDPNASDIRNDSLLDETIIRKDDGKANGESSEARRTVEVGTGNGRTQESSPPHALTESAPVPRFYVYLEHPPGNYHALPWEVGCCWQKMEQSIEAVLEENEHLLRLFKEGKYKLQNQYAINILKQFYDITVQPGWDIRVLFKEEKATDDKPEETSNEAPKDEDTTTVYEDGIKYTIQYYRRNPYDAENPNFDREITHNERIDLTPTGSKRTVPVLEEIQRVTLPAPSEPWVLHKEEDPITESTGGSKTSSKPKFKLPPDAEIGKTVLRINSSYLLNTLQAVMRFVTRDSSGRSDDLKQGIFDYPFRDLYLHKEDLLEYKGNPHGLRSQHSEEYNRFADSHIDQLLDYLYGQPKIAFGAMETDWTREIPVTTFAGVALLLKPGSDVYMREQNTEVAYVIDRVSGGVDYTTDDNTVSHYKVTVWNLLFDGESIIRFYRTVTIPIFEDKRPITSLPLILARFWDKTDNGKVRQRLIARGKKYFRYCEKPSYLEYSGRGLKPGRQKYNRTRVVVEHSSRPWRKEEYKPWMKTWSELDLRVPVPGLPGEASISESARTAACPCDTCAHMPGRQYIRPTYSDYDDIVPMGREKTDPSEHQSFLFDSHMWGFILKDREYDLLDVEHLAEPEISEDAIDRLVMNEKSKSAIKAIVKTYTDRDDSLPRGDFIHGKGEGQVILLHGPPGTGKTLTAESVAEYTKRPLLSITAADLGHDPIMLEKNLLRFFNDASEWDAVVLLDEADVYLQRRDATDLSRNSVVAIFLRALEYFQGILFLTTNRVAQFDEAFKSRIHVSIGYEALNDEAREQIWQNLFMQLRDDHARNRDRRLDITVDTMAEEFVERSQDLKDLKWNGRQIRNGFQTAVALAIFDAKKSGRDNVKPVVTRDHLKQVVRMSTAFKEYMLKAQGGMSDEDLAFHYGNRDDKAKAHP